MEAIHFEDIGADGSVILNWILLKYHGREWTRLISLRIGPSVGLL
jgi:hypothetical protein